MSQNVDVLIIGAGLSGLSLASFLKNENPDISIKVLEKTDRPGGVIQTNQEQGFLMEWGAHGFLDNVPASRKLIDLANLNHEVQKAPLSEFVRYICLDGSLKLIPQNPLKIIMADLIPWSSKFRVLGDLFKPALVGEPTVAEWAKYRFGKALLPFVDAVFTGTYAGDIEKLSIDAVMPGVREAELKHGSVIKGLFKKAKAAKAENKQQAGVKKFGLPAMTSFVNGMETLPKALAKQLGQDVVYNADIQSIHKEEGQWHIKTVKESFSAKRLVFATSLNKGLELWENHMQEKAPLKLPEARVATVALGFGESAQIPFGFGYLAPRKENRFALGTLFSTHMFPGRSPKGHHLIEVILGGSRSPDHVNMDDDALVDHIMQDIRQLMQLPDDPLYIKIVRSKSGIPQLVKGYDQLVKWRQHIEERESDVSFIGFGWGGIGINDMIKEANRLSTDIINGFKANHEKEVKGVYF